MDKKTTVNKDNSMIRPFLKDMIQKQELWANHKYLAVSVQPQT